MEQSIGIGPAFAALVAAGLGGLLGSVGLFDRRAIGVVSHALLAAAVAASVGGLVSVETWTLPRLSPDHVMTAVIAGVGLLGAATALRRRAGLARRVATGALLAFTALVGLLAGSAEPVLAIGAAAVAFMTLAAPEPPVIVRQPRRAGRVTVTVPQHSSLRLP